MGLFGCSALDRELMQDRSDNPSGAEEGTEEGESGNDGNYWHRKTPLYHPCAVDQDCSSGWCTERGPESFCTQPCEISNDCKRVEYKDAIPAFLCADQGFGSSCLMQCLLHPDEPEGWPQGYGATCPTGWLCQWPEGVGDKETGRRQAICFKQP